MSLEAWGDENPDDAEYYSWSNRASEEGWFDPDDYSPGAIAILEERNRQETEEGWTPEHDDQHVGGDIAHAAVCYAWFAAISDGLRNSFMSSPPPTWPETWDVAWWKPEDRRRELVKAGALIAAEIDRLDRIEKANQETLAPSIDPPS